MELISYKELLAENNEMKIAITEIHNYMVNADHGEVEITLHEAYNRWCRGVKLDGDDDE